VQLVITRHAATSNDLTALEIRRLTPNSHLAEALADLDWPTKKNAGPVAEVKPGRNLLK
jgi:hypothetical protein